MSVDEVNPVRDAAQHKAHVRTAMKLHIPYKTVTMNTWARHGCTDAHICDLGTWQRRAVYLTPRPVYTLFSSYWQLMIVFFHLQTTACK